MLTARRASVARSAITDEQLLGRLTCDSDASLAVLFDRYRDRAYRVAWSVCRDDGCAQAAVQETFISIWRPRASHEQRGDVAAWVLTCVRQRAVDVARRSDPPPASARGLHGTLAELPDEQQEVIALGVYGQLTQPEIAAQLDLPLAAIKRRMRLGLQRLDDGVDRR